MNVTLLLVLCSALFIQSSMASIRFSKEKEESTLQRIQSKCLDHSEGCPSVGDLGGKILNMDCACKQDCINIIGVGRIDDATCDTQTMDDKPCICILKQV